MVGDSRRVVRMRAGFWHLFCMVSFSGSRGTLVGSHRGAAPLDLSLGRSIIVLLPALVLYIPPAVFIFTGECWGYIICAENLHC